MCVDYRALNKLTNNNTSSAYSVFDQLGALKSVTCVRSGYYQVRIRLLAIRTAWAILVDSAPLSKVDER